MNLYQGVPDIITGLVERKKLQGVIRKEIEMTLNGFGIGLI